MIISIIILSWNNNKHLNNCLKSIINQKNINEIKLEIIVVDNGSTETINFDNDFSPKLIKLARNLGFSEGMNIGYRNSSGDFVLMLNQDVVLDENYINKGLEIFLKNPRIAWAGGPVYKIQNEICTNKLEHSGYFLKKRFQPTFSKNSIKNERVFMVSPASMFIRRNVLDLVSINGNIFPNYFFAYWEDVDLAYRILSASYLIGYFPELITWHYISASTSGKRGLIDKPFNLQVVALSNRRSVMIRNLSNNDIKNIILICVLVEIFLPLYYLFISRKTFIALLMSYFRNFLNLKNDLKSRIEISKKRIVDTIYCDYKK